MPLWKQALLRRLHNPEGGSEGGDQSTAGGAIDTSNQTVEPPKNEPPKPSDAEARLLQESMRRKEEVARLKGELASLNDLKSRIESLGGLDQLSQLVQAQRDAEEKRMQQAGEWERLRERMASEHDNQLKGVLTERDTVRSQLDQAIKQINELTIGTAFSQSKFIAEEMVLPASKARTVYGEHFDLVDGQIVGYDKPRGAKDRTPLVDAQGSPVQFEVALRKLVEADPERDYLLKAKAKPGAASDTRRTQAAPKTEELKGISRIQVGLKSLNVAL